jgi:ABC-type polysaccharide/polyol phosphate export permease
MMAGVGPTRSIAEIPQPSWWQDLLDGAQEAWRARDLIKQLTVRDIRVRYQGSVMGFAWAILTPVLVVLSGLIVRVAMTEARGGALEREVVLTLAIKGLAWGFFAGAVGFGTSSLTASGYLLSKVYFPRAVLPISSNLVQGFDTGVASVAVAMVSPWLGMHVSPALLWVPLLVLLLMGLTLGSTLVLCCANVFFRDVKYIVQVLLTFGIFFTPVFYEPAMLGPRGTELVMLNPLSPLLEGLRLAVVSGHNLWEPLVVTNQSGPVAVWLPRYLWYSMAWATGGLLAGATIFRRAESWLAEFV